MVSETLSLWGWRNESLFDCRITCLDSEAVSVDGVVLGVLSKLRSADRPGVKSGRRSRRSRSLRPNCLSVFRCYAGLEEGQERGLGLDRDDAAFVQPGPSNMSVRKWRFDVGLLCGWIVLP